MCPSGIQGTKTRERLDYVSLRIRHDLFKGWITLSKFIQWIMQSSGSLSNSVFERRTSTGSCFFTPLRRDFEQIFGQIVSIRVKTLSNTNLVGPRHIKREKRLLPVDVRRSKTSLLKLPIFPNSYLLDSDLSGSLHNRRNTYFFAVFGRAKARVKRARSIRHALRLPSFA